MNLNRNARILAALLAAGLLTACGGAPSSDAEAAGDLLAQIQARGEMIVATEGTWSPFTYHNEADELVGYDVEVARLVAEKLGVAATFVEGEFDGLLAGLDAGRYDLVANGINLTDEREEAYDFSDPYLYDPTVVIVRSDYDEIATLEDLAGKTTANTITSTYAVMAEEYGATVTGVDDFAQTIELLEAGRIDATLNSIVSYNDYLAQQPDAPIKIAVTGDALPLCLAVRQGDDTATFRAAVNEALDELRASGELAALSQQYFGEDRTNAG